MDMKRRRPNSSRAQELPALPQQPEGPIPAKRLRLEESSCLRSHAQPLLEEDSRPTSEHLTSRMCLGADCTLKLHREDLALLLEPEPTSVMQGSLHGHHLSLAPQAVQSFTLPAQPGFCPSGSQEAALLDMPREHGIISQQGSSTARLTDTEGFSASASEPPEDCLEGFLRPLPWMNAPAGMVPAFYLPFPGVPGPWGPGAPPDADRYAPGKIWSLQSSTRQPRSSSSLQPLPPSPPQNHQEDPPQCPLKPSRPRCKAQRCLF